MIKKISKMLGLCLAICLMLAACGAPTPENTSSGKNASSEDNASTTGDKYEENPADYKIALMIPGSLGDKSFFDASYEAIGLIEKEIGAKVDYVEAGTDASKYYATYVDLCEGGYDLILTVSSNGDDALSQIAEEYPDQKFINLDGEMDEIPSNVYIIARKNNEMSFLAGAVAALKAQELGESTVGFVGGMDIPGINEFLVGYIEGAQQILPDVKVSSSYVGSFTDTAKGKENASLLYDSGISVIFAAAGQSGLGVIDAASSKGKFVIGVDSDQAEALKDSQPLMADTIITSAIKNISSDALNIVKEAMDGKIEYGTKGYYGLKEGSVGIADNEYYEKIMTQDQRDQISKLQKQVENGEIEMTDTVGLSTDELNKIRDGVRP